MERTPTIKAGWWFAGLSLLIPVFAVGAVIFGAISATKNRVGQGAAIIAVGLILGICSAAFWSAVLVPDKTGTSSTLTSCDQTVDFDCDGIPDGSDTRPYGP